MKADTKHIEKTKLYEFTDEGNSCKILCPETPRYWYTIYGMKIAIAHKFLKSGMAGAIILVKTLTCA